MTKAEMILWKNLRNRKIDNFRFRRQHPVNEFIVDFFCYEARLVIEVDGEVHEDDYQKERDQQRTKILNKFGLKVIRFTNKQIENNIELVIRKINNELHGSIL